MIKINDRLISNEHPPYIVAEISANHNGNLQNALKLIELSAEAGADAVKI
jgi:sialic acid synthase SpsE